ncbi:MAG: nucleotide exchange factor GrpE [Nitrospiraceae bacterium]
MNHEQENNQTISDLDRQEHADPAGETDGASVPQSEETDAEGALAAKREEAQALQDKYLRLAAEFENYKRLAQRDRRDQAKFANENLLNDLLPVIDNLERAIGFSKSIPGGDGLIQGVELTLKQFLETLAKFGVKPISSVGSMFDPSRHQAVAHVPTAGAAENTVVEEYQKGYLLHDRILRAAMVAVAAASSEPGGAPSETPHVSY